MQCIHVSLLLQAVVSPLALHDRIEHILITQVLTSAMVRQQTFEGVFERG